MFETISLFSYPVLKSNFGYVLNEKEYKKIDDLKLDSKKHGAENIVQSKHSYVLDLKEFENLKKYIQNFIHIYKKEILNIEELKIIYNEDDDDDDIITAMNTQEITRKINNYLENKRQEYGKDE